MFWVLFLIVACVAAAVSCARLCLAASVAAGHPERPVDAARPAPAPQDYELSLYETAFLAGGPVRVADLALVSMHRRRRLLLAHTGWATVVVDPRGEDDVERSVLGAIGPAGQSPVAAIRTATTTADAVRAVADRLVSAGLAVPDAVRAPLTSAVRSVRAATLLVLALAAASLLLPGQEQAAGRGLVAAWFALPLGLSLGCLAIARFEIHTYTGWASPAGRRVLDALAPGHRTGERAFLTAVARLGVRAVDDPHLRAALAARRGH
ncbi:TIGR04222 domain-containing membrane protein [Streptomyces flavidovirens]|uniref:TIGR04222 domain-containing membrane protein n=1 Tax=Streptomyces flavidovirens TaxID=67298 RepID=UPI0004090C23|nr:TIGR04222 domain-containing membrane protein [Streptomyces flavidovirens]